MTNEKLREGEWKKYGERADYYAPDATVYPQNVVEIILASREEEVRQRLLAWAGTWRGRGVSEEAMPSFHEITDALLSPNKDDHE